MNVKKTILTYLIILIIAISTYVGFWAIIKSNYDYKSINRDTEETVATIIDNSKGELPHLQTDSCSIKWDESANDKQTVMMDNVLGSLTVLGELKKGLPKQYIIATYYDNMKIYIPYNEINPYKNIIIEYNEHYYVSTANKEAISSIVDDMIKERIIFEHRLG